MPPADKGNSYARQQATRKRPAVRATPASHGDTKGDLKKGASFQRSRPYYRAYEEAQRKNPVVKKAIKTVDKEFSAKRYTSKAVKRAQADIEIVRQQGSDTVAKAGYRHYTKGLWAKAKGEYSGSDKRPGFQVSDRPPKNAIAYVFDGHNIVHYGRPLMRHYMDANGSPRRDEAKTVPLHEWAHTRQYPGLPESFAEGSAEIKRRDVAKKLRIRVTPSSRKYGRYEKGLRRFEHKAGKKRVERKLYR